MELGSSKKGKANGYGEKDLLNITCNYNWNINGKSDDPDVEYAAIRQNWDAIMSVYQQGITHLLGCNEPNDKNQSNCTVDQVIEMWPEMLKSGLRLGSPAPTSVWAWNGDFFNLITQLGYRCDFAVAHIYENSLNATSLVDRVKHLSEVGKGRPVRDYGMKNSLANRTTEWWPTAKVLSVMLILILFLMRMAIPQRTHPLVPRMQRRIASSLLRFART